MTLIHMKKCGCRFGFAQKFYHVGLARKVQELVAVAASSVGQVDKSTGCALGPLGVKVDKYFIHNDGQGHGVSRVVFDVSQTQGKVSLLARTSAEVFWCEGFTLCGQDV